MDIPSLDLNLLTALHALLSERNVTRAGERIGLSQPATSAALARLRRHFGDELLERVGSQYQLTTLATSLLEQSEIALRYIEHTFAARPLFDAGRSEREFTVVASDYALAVLGAGIGKLLAERAPWVRLRFTAPDNPTVDQAVTTMRTHDAILLPHGFMDDLPGRRLFEDDWVVLAARQPGAVPRVLTAQDLGVARWVVVYDRPTQFTPADKAMRLLGHDRRADIVVEQFAAVPALITGCDRLALFPRLLARRYVTSYPVEMLEVPVELPRLSEHIWWHPSHASDPGHRWLVQLIVDAAALTFGAAQA